MLEEYNYPIMKKYLEVINKEKERIGTYSKEM